jgi:hypothetical protein
MVTAHRTSGRIPAIPLVGQAGPAADVTHPILRRTDMKQFATIPSAVVMAIAVSGCASIAGGHNQDLSVDTKRDGVAVTQVDCKLSNDKGAWHVTTPASVTVRRSFEDLAVNCEKDGQEPGSLTVKSSTKGLAFGNILFGGVIGAGVDMASGAAYDYPKSITVEMGKDGVLKQAASTGSADAESEQVGRAAEFGM